MSNTLWLDKAIEAIKASTPESAVYIGCDSIRFPKRVKTPAGKFLTEWYARYSVVVVLHNNVDSVSRGCSLFHNTFVERDYGGYSNLRPRMMREAQEAIDVGIYIREALGESDTRSIQVHLDINPQEEHKSSVAVREALGWARGMGLDAKVKPEAWAATHAADHVARYLGSTRGVPLNS